MSLHFPSPVILGSDCCVIQSLQYSVGYTCRNLWAATKGKVAKLSPSTAFTHLPISAACFSSTSLVSPRRCIREPRMFLAVRMRMLLYPQEVAPFDVDISGDDDTSSAHSISHWGKLE